MRGKKVTAIKRAATIMNDGEKPNGTEMRILKKLNKDLTIPQIKKGDLITIS